MKTNRDDFTAVRRRQGQIICRLQSNGLLHVSCRGARSNQPSRRAFSRLDLVVTLFTACLLAGWFGFSHMGERGRIAKCAYNLRRLGQAMQEYADDHAGGLPPAAVPQCGNTWDSLIAPYLKGNSRVSHSAYARQHLEKATAPYFHCPSDLLVRGNPRSYAIPANDMEPEHWRLDANTASGVGLWWGKDQITRLLGLEAVEMSVKTPSILPMVKVSIIHAPADTLLLTELIHQDNVLRHPNRTVVKDVGDQYEQPEDHAMSYHNGRFNYLMVDGHVEWLTGLQTGGIDGKSGIWTIRKGD